MNEQAKEGRDCHIPPDAVDSPDVCHHGAPRDHTGTLTHTQPGHHHPSEPHAKLLSPCMPPPHPSPTHSLPACPLPIHLPPTHTFPLAWGSWWEGGGWGRAGPEGPQRRLGQGLGEAGKVQAVSPGGQWGAWWGAHKDEGGRRVAGPVQLRSPPQQPAWVQKGLFVLCL